MMRAVMMFIALVMAVLMVGCAATDSAAEQQNFSQAQAINDPWELDCEEGASYCSLLKVPTDKTYYLTIYQNPDTTENVLTFHRFADVTLANHLRITFGDVASIDVADLAQEYVEHKPNNLIYLFSESDWLALSQRFRGVDEIRLEMQYADTGEWWVQNIEAASFEAAWNELQFHQLFMESQAF
ncbi:hypothetical protein [Saccharospirillum mangrovi]|uniref:hypothetical protein n=1 Tax=Saccharospirillum mangrovi TaxID=2161747 RepID=UPI0013007BE1|nr:hypothetical protein [Saccharospirillum mangrovi]